ncbi:MAG: hemerythrin family protein [Rhodospirillales bacterium]|nr:hemerythrin family protein [Rhodospirillales bacterium]
MSTSDMPAVAWGPNMSVGVEALDTDHKMLFGLVNQLADAIAKGQAEPIVASIINGLVDYTEYHFGREEAMMRACGYAALEAHIASHHRLVEALQHLRDAHAGGFRDGIERRLLDFMRGWITTHILGEDMKYAPVMKGREADLARVNETYTRWLTRPDAAETSPDP